MAKHVRIAGLVRTAEVVRRELGSGVTPQRREHLRQRVNENLQIVQQILLRNSARVNDLPLPSQRAYQFLAGLQWENVPTADSPANVPAVPQSMLTWPGMSAFIDRMLRRLDSAVDERELNEIGQTIDRTSRQMEQTIQRRSVEPEGLSELTRTQRGWLAFFARPENVQAYAAARRSAGQILDRAAAGSRQYPPPLEIHFRPMNGIYRLRSDRGRALLWLPTPMIAFDENAFQSLADMAFDRAGEARQRVIQQMAGDAFQAVRAELEALGGIVEQTQGAAHDLASAFDRVNAQYFGGKMARPRLTWNRTLTGRKFGHYDWIHDTVMVSRTLDAAHVPQFVVDFLVFHELLHKFHGVHWVNGRGYAHTAEFYESERKFARYREGEEILAKLAREIR